MFELLVVACLSGQAVCAERLVPMAAPDLGNCQAAAGEASRTWAEERDLVARDVSCVATSDLPRRLEPLGVVEVAEGVYVHQGKHAIPNARNAGDLANLGFVIGGDAVAVIDAGGSRAVAERLYAAILTKTDLPVRYLILTHMHPDHALGAELFRELGAEIIGHPNLEQALANRASSYMAGFLDLLGGEAFLGTQLIGPDRSISDGTLDLGGRVLEVRSHPLAHTESDLTVLDRQTRIWFVGDLVFAGHTPALDGSLTGWQKALAEMAEEDVHQIVPGHGPAAMDWPAGADATRLYLEVLADETRAAIAVGEPMTQATHHIGESQRENWLLFDEFNRRNATAAYKELEWE
ncbi:MAG: quinoprotein relay system zinc metallohydrolase 2 [Pseudomonadota bacterium]